MFQRLKKALFRWFAYGFLAFLLLSLVLVLPLRWIAPPTTAFVIQETGLGGTNLRSTWVPLKGVAESLPLAVIASEDQKFPHHWGFDLDSIEKALTEDRARMRGASTLTQQLAKNLYLWPGRSLVRKGIEAWFTLLLETTLSKRRIMELYLNVVEFGPGIYGVKRAARHHFNTGPARLTERQGALLAAVLPNPKRMNAGRPSDYVSGRASEIQVEMRRLGRGHLPW